MKFVVRIRYGAKETIVNYHQNIHTHKETSTNDSDGTDYNMENGGINYKGDDVESLSDRNNNDESTHSGGSVYDIFE